MPAKELGRSSTYWDKRRLLKYTANEKKSTKYINDIRALYNKANDDIDKMLKDVYKNYSKDTGIDVQTLKTLLTKSETKKTWKELEKQGLDKYIKANYKSRITRLEQIKAQVYAKAKSVYNDEELKQTELYKSVITDSYYKAIYNTQMGTGLNFAFSKIDNNMMNTLLSNKWSGRNYSKRIWTNTDILANEVSKIVGGSLLSGKGVELTAREIRDRFGVSKYYAERLVRTETNYYDNQADAMAYEEMGIEEFVPVAVLDNRTSQYCADIDGKHFKYSEMEVGVNFPPFHPNCRCTTRGYLGKEAEKLLTRRARNPVTGETEVIPNMTYNEWLRQNANGTLGLSSDSLSNTETKRIYIGKFSKKNIDKMLEKYENSINGNDFESAFVFQADGKVYKFVGGEQSVDIFGVNLDNAIITHNHPIDGDVYRSFGEDDFNFIKNTKSKNVTLRVTTPEFKDIIKKTKDIDIGYNDVYKEAMIRCFNNENLEIQSEAIKILKERGYVSYERRIR